jgi:hypothetical protein
MWILHNGGLVNLAHYSKIVAEERATTQKWLVWACSAHERILLKEVDTKVLAEQYVATMLRRLNGSKS